MDLAHLNELTARKVGKLPKANRTEDVVDADTARLLRPRDVVLSRDDADVKVLLRLVKATVVHM